MYIFMCFTYKIRKFFEEVSHEVLQVIYMFFEEIISQNIAASHGKTLMFQHQEF
jgi:hypothetical protein